MPDVAGQDVIRSSQAEFVDKKSPSLTASPRVSQNKSKPKMVKAKKPEIGVWKTVESKSRHKNEKEKPKTNKKLPVKSSKQKDIKHASRAKNFKQPKSVPKQKFYNQNRQWNYAPMSMPFPSYGSSMYMPWGAYFNMPYSCTPWFHNSYMPSLPTYLHPNYITYREPTISEPSPTKSGRFDSKNRHVQKRKYKVIEQVYRVKKDG